MTEQLRHAVMCVKGRAAFLGVECRAGTAVWTVRNNDRLVGCKT